MLEIRNLTAGYPEKTVLSELSLAVPVGSLTVIVGPNGCGKSTLLKAITGLLPASGSVNLLGEELRTLPSAQFARRIAYMPQNRPVPELTAGKLVLHGRFPWLGYPRRYREEDRRIARAAMEQLGIESLENRYLPELSGGERQKVYLAMLLAQQTPLILMDEPTASLDIANKFELMDISRQLVRQGKTVVMVLHDLDLAMRYADVVAVMEAGKIRCYASGEEVYRSGILQQVFRVRMEPTATPEGEWYCFLPEKTTQPGGE